MGAIICGLDDSESARGAARVARGLSGELGLDLVFVRVLEDSRQRVDGRPTDSRICAAATAGRSGSSRSATRPINSSLLRRRPRRR
jgi:hypothetical protein